METNNLKVKKTLAALTLAGTIATTSLTGCGSTEPVKERYPQVAVIFGENSATIIECEDVSFGNSTNISIREINGGSIKTSRIDTKIFFNMSYEEIEKLIIDIKGEDVDINYFNVEKAYTKKREK